MVGGVNAFGAKPPVLILALKKGDGLLLWARVRDPADRQWADVPPMPEVETELRAAHRLASNQAADGCNPREGRGVGLPKVEVGRKGRVRVDLKCPGVRDYVTLHPGTLTPAACAAVWKLWREPLPVAEVTRSRPLPTRVRVTVPPDRETSGRDLAPAFELESELEKYLAKNWNEVALSSRLDFMGRQVPTSHRGHIDILCRNKDGTGYTVVELKRDQSNFAALGQVQTYMAWVRGTKVTGDQSVWGIIICREADQRLMDAVSEARNVDVYSYARQGRSVVLTKVD